MSHQIAADRFSSEIFDLFHETFEQVQGIYLDKGSSLFETLATISAAEASRPVSASCASLAAQVEHVRFYIDTLSAYMRGENPGRVDWGEIWRTVQQVTPQEWEASKARLRASYDAVLTLMQSFVAWDGEEQLSGALAIIVHTAYHLGEIRQALCTLRLAEPGA